MAGPLRIAAAAAHFGRDLPRSVDRIAMIIDAARKVEAGLLVLPNAALGGYLADLRSPDPAALPPAIAPDAMEIRRIIALAGDMVVCFGYNERFGGQRWSTNLDETSRPEPLKFTPYRAGIEVTHKGNAHVFCSGRKGRESVAGLLS